MVREFARAEISTLNRLVEFYEKILELHQVNNLIVFLIHNHLFLVVMMHFMFLILY